jgi:hypothetical protein
MTSKQLLQEFINHSQYGVMSIIPKLELYIDQTETKSHVAITQGESTFMSYLNESTVLLPEQRTKECCRNIIQLIALFATCPITQPLTYPHATPS